MNDDDVFHQASFRYRFDWGQTGVRNLAPLSDVIVIIDVLSFTTCVDIAVSCGATVFPYRYKDESAQAFADSVRAQLAGARGEREQRGTRGQLGTQGTQGLTPSLSPATLQSLEPGTRIVLPSPNGSACTVAAFEAGAGTTGGGATGAVVIAGCLRNASAVARFIRECHAKDAVTVIACGEHWPNGSLRPSVEDLLAAGAILSHFEGELSPEARVAVGAFRAMEGSLAEALRECASGRELIARGFPEDVDIASELNVSQVVPVLQDGAYKKG